MDEHPFGDGTGVVVPPMQRDDVLDSAKHHDLHHPRDEVAERGHHVLPRLNNLGHFSVIRQFCFTTQRAETFIHGVPSAHAPGLS